MSQTGCLWLPAQTHFTFMLIGALMKEIFYIFSVFFSNYLKAFWLYSSLLVRNYGRRVPRLHRSHWSYYFARRGGENAHSITVKRARVLWNNWTGARPSTLGWELLSIKLKGMRRLGIVQSEARRLPRNQLPLAKTGRLCHCSYLHLLWSFRLLGTSCNVTAINFSLSCKPSEVWVQSRLEWGWQLNPVLASLITQTTWCGITGQASLSPTSLPTAAWEQCSL